MHRLSRFAVLLAAAVAVAACKPKPDAAEESATDDSAAADSASAPTLALLDACKIRMTQPEAHEWDTKWDPAHTRTAGQNPSGIRSVHWASESEQKVQFESNTAIPFDMVCGNDDRESPTITFSITAFDSSPADVPLTPGVYPIAPKASPAHNKPGEFIVGALLFDQHMFQAASGTLKLDRFDMNGAAGSFVIDGNEILTGSRPVHIEGTFDMPCREGMLQSACKSGKAER
jgi:hypothetical protein